MARAEAVTAFDVVSDDGGERYGWIIPLSTENNRWVALSLYRLHPTDIGHYSTPNEAFKAIMLAEHYPNREVATDES